MKNKKPLLFFLHVLFLLVLLLVEDYQFIYCSFCTLMVLSIVNSETIHEKAIRIFIVLYYSISLIPGSSYRGITTYNTFELYTMMNYWGSIALLFLSYRPVLSNLEFSGIYLNRRSISFIRLHLMTVYILLVYVFAKYGFIMFHQDDRFGLDGTISYLIKSSIYIPLIYFACANKKRDWDSVLSYYILPLLPALFIGSRGTVLMVLFGILIYKLLSDQEIIKRLTRKVRKNYIRIVLATGVLGLAVIVGLFYIRRSNSMLLMSGVELVNIYFDSPNVFTYILAPLHFSLKEQIGITDVIIGRHYQNPLPHTMFFADMFTMLPGKQTTSGITLNMMVGNNDYAGLTPGILGAVYLDFGQLAVYTWFFMICFSNILFKRSRNNAVVRLYYVLTLIQLFHLYHRGFFKPEYLFSYAVLFCYIQLVSKKRNLAA